MLTRLIFVGLMLGLWFLSQKLIGSRNFTGQGIQDKIHIWTSKWHSRLLANDKAANALLISSSFVVDCVGIYLLLGGIFGPSITPFLGLVLIMGLRQISQYLTALPVPEGMIWRHPGLPSALVTYGVSNDLFFSGHTALAVYGGLQFFHMGHPALMLLGIMIAIFEITTVLVLRAHWTMDVFTGIVTALLVDKYTADLGPWIDTMLSAWS